MCVLRAAPCANERRTRNAGVHIGTNDRSPSRIVGAGWSEGECGERAGLVSPSRCREARSRLRDHHLYSYSIRRAASRRAVRRAGRVASGQPTLWNLRQGAIRRYHGPGKATFANGARYTGDFLKGFMHGHGEYTWADGTMYAGDFVYNRITGKQPRRQALRRRTGRQRGSRAGSGRYVWPSGNVYEGQVRDRLWASQ